MLPRVDLIRAGDTSWLLMNSPDLISDHIRKKGVWGENELFVCRLFLQGIHDGIVIDAGANLGGFTVPVARELMGTNGRVYSFEPQRVVFQQLCANIFLNRIDNVYCQNVALGDVSEEVLIPELNHELSQNVGQFSMDRTIRDNMAKEAEAGRNRPNYNAPERGMFTVPKRPLDDFGLYDRVAFIKVDVEGCELEVFKGSVVTLEKNNFPPLLYELWENIGWYAEKAKETVGFLTRLGYTFERIGEDVLAQHPKHPRKCLVNRNQNTVNLQMVQG